MNFTADIFNSIFEDIDAKPHGIGSSAMRMIPYGNGVYVGFSVNVITRMRAIYLSFKSSMGQSHYPHWNGVSISTVELPAYGTEQKFVALTQLPQSEGYIFEIVSEDLRRSVAEIDSPNEALGIITAVLAKWKEFFQSDKEILLSEERQQGLYGELLFVDEYLKLLGPKIIFHWAGSNDETHDFYLSSNAVEIKTTSSQTPYYAHISSEYQLDTTDVPGRLFLRFYSFRKSQSGGDRLPQIVTRIRQKLAIEDNMVDLFNEKLKKYGYFDEVADQYCWGYFIRDEYSFEIKGNFPRLTKANLVSGVSDLVYAIGIGHCMNYALEKEALALIMKGGNLSVER